MIIWNLSNKIQYLKIMNIFKFIWISRMKWKQILNQLTI